MKKILLIIFALLLVNLVSAQIAVKEVISQPQKTAPGENIILTIVLENVGDDDIKSVAVKLDLSSLPFAPLESSTEQVIDEISEGDSEQVRFNLITLPEGGRL